MDATIFDIMTRDVITVSPGRPLREITTLFKKHHVRHIPVVEGSSLKGIISLSDVMRMSFGNKFGEVESDTDEVIFEMLTLDQVMMRNVKTVTPDMAVREVAEMLTNEEFHALPVVEGDKLVGIVTTTDIIRHLVKISYANRD